MAPVAIRIEPPTPNAGVTWGSSGRTPGAGVVPETVDLLSDRIVVDAGALVFDVAVEFTPTVAFTARVAEALGA